MKTKLPLKHVMNPLYVTSARKRARAQEAPKSEEGLKTHVRVHSTDPATVNLNAL